MKWGGRSAAQRRPGAIEDLRFQTLTIDGTATNAILDVEGTLARFGGDQRLFVEMTTFMLEDAPLHLSKLRSAVAAGDAKSIECNAHALKGLLMNGGGVRAASVAQAVEDSGHARDLGKAYRLLQSLDAEVDTLTKAIRDCVKSNRESVT
jgi:HPt (histidine-containing phosphotransfer) domain-containing protein